MIRRVIAGAWLPQLLAALQTATTDRPDLQSLFAEITHG
jgi:hypothetical protein